MRLFVHCSTNIPYGVRKSKLSAAALWVDYKVEGWNGQEMGGWIASRAEGEKGCGRDARALGARASEKRSPTGSRRGRRGSSGGHEFKGGEIQIGGAL